VLICADNALSRQRDSSLYVKRHCRD